MMLKQPPSTKREVDMTPMIDCVFLLLIFFLVATDIKRTETSANVQLPKSVEALIDAIKGKPAPLVVSILPKKAGETGLGDRPYWILNKGYNLEDLKKVLHAQAEEQYNLNHGEQAIVRLRADRRATLEQLQYALKACQEARIISIYIAATKI